MSERKRSAEYRDLLNTIYGKSVVDAFVKSSSDEVLEKYDSDKLNTFIKTRNTKDGKQWEENEGCKECKELCEGFSKRKMDFPGWLGALDFSKKNTKKIMLIGEDVGPIVKAYINIAYGLGRYKIDMETSVLAEEPGNHLWKILKKIFTKEIGSKTGLEGVMENIYISDMIKCNVSNEQKIKQLLQIRCSCAYLLEEIKLIRPMVIIFQGKNAYDYARQLFADNMIEATVAPEYRINDNFPKYGEIKVDRMNIKFLKIFHSVRRVFYNRKCWNNDSNIERFQQILDKEILTGLDL